MSRLASELASRGSPAQCKISKFFTSKVPPTEGQGSACRTGEDTSFVSVDGSNGKENENMPPKRKADSEPCKSEPATKKIAVQLTEKSSTEMPSTKALFGTSTPPSGLLSGMGLTWYNALKAECSKPYFQKLTAFVTEERKKNVIFPPMSEVFSWTTITPIRDIKVVILGQDPYHGPGQAHGLCFSVKKGVAPPPSLENMFKELSTDIDGFKKPSHGDLTGWAQQGVLLLNAVLTVRQHTPNSHKDQGWEQFTDAVIAWLNANTTGTVFILWGSYAQKKGKCINKSKHHVISGAHPSPLSAHRGFFGCKHFSKCNEFLKQQNKEPIDWSRFV